MRILPLIPVVLVLLLASKPPQDDSPHGKDFAISCSLCHNPESWEVDPARITFDHSTTAMPLRGQHTRVDCRGCHVSLEFGRTETDCAACHTDMHEQTLGNECDRCHTPDTWLVSTATDIHRNSRFPLLGAHHTAECMQCHPSASSLRFEPLGVECIDCHQSDYQAAANPNHVAGNFSTQCDGCHEMTSTSWEGGGFSHAFFPLTGGHNLADCRACHSEGTFTGLSTDCYACHRSDYENTLNPNHIATGLSQTCSDCHGTEPGWKPASFTIHDAQFFPIYSGTHRGTWDNCTQCHEDPANYANFTCLSCHEHRQSKMDDEHHEESGYSYNSLACLDCHPIGRAED
ncbi:MAG: hypothetical protein R2751_07235 [Bacteroidales bacterium]